MTFQTVEGKLGTCILNPASCLYHAAYTMQNTRLNRLVTSATNRANQWLGNPWRRLSLIIIGLLFGFYLASAVATVAGQAAKLDIFGAGLVVASTEIVSRLVYSRLAFGRSTVGEILNATKIGLIYGLSLEAFKLGS